MPNCWIGVKWTKLYLSLEASLKYFSNSSIFPNDLDNTVCNWILSNSIFLPPIITFGKTVI